MPKTEELGYHGLYEVTVRAEFEQPSDYTQSVMVPVFNEYTFEIEMIDPCFASTMDPL